MGAYILTVTGALVALGIVRLLDALTSYNTTEKVIGGMVIAAYSVVIAWGMYLLWVYRL